VANDGETGEGDNIALDIEGATGGSGNDTVVGSASDDTLDGGPGNDNVNAAPVPTRFRAAPATTSSTAGRETTRSIRAPATIPQGRPGHRRDRPAGTASGLDDVADAPMSSTAAMA
jgi:Ca2+-binding RTX toxin-like protein